MPRWWRRKRRQEKADSRKASDNRPQKPRPNAAARGSAPVGAETQATEKEKAPAPQAEPAENPKAEPAENPKPDGDGTPAPSPDRPRPLKPVPPPDPAESPAPDTPPAAARASDAEAATDAPEDDAGVSSLTDKVQAVLVAAESTAERIRRDAEADAARVAEERERQRHAARELLHLERLADALSVQAESVKRQCGVLRGLLPEVEDLPAERSTPADLAVPEPGESAEDVLVRDLRGQRRDGDQPEASEDGAGGDPAEGARRFPAISRERVEAYRMKLAGVCRTDVEAYLVAAGVDEAAEITAELFDPLAPARTSS